MKKTDLLMYGGLAIIAGVLIYSVAGLFTNLPATDAILAEGSQAVSSAENPFPPVLTGTTGPGDVAIELTPLGVKEGKLEVQIAANTHSVDLSPFDLKELTTLEYTGKLLKPQSVPRLVGHHVYGVMAFPLAEDPGEFAITITGIPRVGERIFEWG